MDTGFDATARALASHIRTSMTPEQIREAADERKNVFLALELNDPVVLFVMAERMHAVGATDINSFMNGCEAGLRAAGMLVKQ